MSASKLQKMMNPQIRKSQQFGTCYKTGEDRKHSSSFSLSEGVASAYICNNVIPDPEKVVHYYYWRKGARRQKREAVQIRP